MASGPAGRGHPGTTGTVPNDHPAASQGARPGEVPVEVRVEDPVPSADQTRSRELGATSRRGRLVPAILLRDPSSATPSPRVAPGDPVSASDS